MSMHYRGDAVAGIEARIASGIPMGPNLLGERMWPTSATYDAETDRTTVEFTLEPPELVQTFLDQYRAQMPARVPFEIAPDVVDAVREACERHAERVVWRRDRRAS